VRAPLPLGHKFRNIVDHINSTVQKSDLKEKEKFLNLLVYVMHPEVAGGLGNHVLKFSRFFCERGDTWIASITLRSWLVRENSDAKFAKAQTFKDDESIYLPDLKPLWKNTWKEKEKPRLQKLSFELDVSSIVISTNDFGDFSKCTVVSLLLGDDDMEIIVKQAHILWQKFVHQPQTARCLVFFLVLEKMCEHVTKNYKEAIKELTNILSLNVSQSFKYFETADC
jgi:hypothetical protein